MFIKLSKKENPYERIAINLDYIVGVEEKSCNTNIIVDNHDGTTETIGCWESFDDVMRMLNEDE